MGIVVTNTKFMTGIGYTNSRGGQIDVSLTKNVHEVCVCVRTETHMGWSGFGPQTFKDFIRACKERKEAKFSTERLTPLPAGSPVEWTSITPKDNGGLTIRATDHGNFPGAVVVSAADVDAFIDALTGLTVVIPVDVDDFLRQMERDLRDRTVRSRLTFEEFSREPRRYVDDLISDRQFTKARRCWNAILQDWYKLPFIAEEDLTEKDRRLNAELAAIWANVQGG